MLCPLFQGVDWLLFAFNLTIKLPLFVLSSFDQSAKTKLLHPHFCRPPISLISSHPLLTHSPCMLCPSFFACDLSGSFNHSITFEQFIPLPNFCTPAPYSNLFTSYDQPPKLFPFHLQPVNSTSCYYPSFQAPECPHHLIYHHLQTIQVFCIPSPNPTCLHQTSSKLFTSFAQHPTNLCATFTHLRHV